MSGLIDSRDGLVFGDGLQFIDGLGGSGLIVETIPAWVLAPGGVEPYIDLDFINDRVWINGVETTITTAIVTCARASPATTYYPLADGTLTSFAANTLRRGNCGALVEESRTNVVLHSRDLTNAAWTKTNCTAAKDQTGPDGTLNGASSLTATAGNATCLQSITLASSARWQSCYMKRLTGSGTIEMTMDNGSTWTAVSPTSSWGPVEIATQTLANPTVGFRIVTNGDAVAIDFVQNENDNLQRSSPIPTTTGSVTRSADDVQLTGSALSWLNAIAMTIYAQGSGNVPSDSTPSALYQIDHTSGSTLIFARQGTSGMTQFARNSAATTQWNANVDSTAATGQPSIKRQRAITSMATNDIVMVGTQGIIATDTSASIPSDISRVSLFSQQTNQFWNSFGERFTAWTSALSDANTKILAASNCDFFVQFDGNSIAVSPAQSTSMAGYLRWSLLPVGYDVRNYATSGATMATLVSRASTVDDDLAYYRANSPTGRQMLVLVVGYNDYALDGDTTAQFLSQLYDYTDARRSAGHTVCVISVTPSTTAGLNTWRATVNADIAANVGVRLDYYVDLYGTSVGEDADASDPADYPDGIHPSASAQIVIAGAVKDQAIDLEAAS